MFANSHAFLGNIGFSWRGWRVLGAGALSLSLLWSTAACGPAGPQVAARGEPPALPALPARDSARIFVSGHSLTDAPMPGDLARIARSLDTPAWVNHQMVIGSSIRARTRGVDGSAPWSGYSQGVNREGEGMDVLAELRAPRTVPGPYEVLLVTERHDLGGILAWEDPVRALRHLHERLIAANPQAQTYFYEPWSSVADLDRPGDWVAYERAATPLWQCLATRVNLSLEAEGRADRIRTVPAASALAHLVARAVDAPGLPGLSRPGAPASETLALLFTDRVHLTRLGSYYMALVNYAAIYGRSPVGAWAPEDIDAAQAQALQQVAWSFASAAPAQPALSLPACRAQWQASFCDTFWDHWRGADAGWMDRLRTWRHATQCRSHLSAETTDNPLFFDPAADRAIWWPAP
jgi:hypothetical protein